jgi:hypothetical protein
MFKSYFKNINEICPDDLLKGLLGFGLFAENLPHFLSSEAFYQYCINRPNQTNFQKTGCDYIRYDSMRDINIPRALGIPNPFAYANLCFKLKEYWNEIKEHFYKQTKDESHKISRIHLRKIEKSNRLFEMNYKHEEKDGIPEQSLIIKSKYLVEADISNCYPSMYSHAVCWALVGKNIAQSEKTNKKQWFNVIDKYLRNIKNGETNGFLIGPDTSCIFSEIILTTIDKKLWDIGYRYVRNIDDYSCYVATHEQAEQFLLDLSRELKNFELSINSKKVKIIELPKPTNTSWVNKLNTFYFGNKYTKDNTPILELANLKSYLDLAIELALSESKFSVLNYAIKVIAKKILGKNAKIYYIDKIHHFLLSYPYLSKLMEDYVFSAFDVEKNRIKNIAQDLYDIGINKNLYEACCFAVYWSIIYDFDIEKNITKESISTNDCMFMLISYLQRKYNRDKESIIIFKQRAMELKNKDFDRFWLFVYEVLSCDDLDGTYKEIKNKGISFINIKNNHE